jgi:hypothetical protein
LRSSVSFIFLLFIFFHAVGVVPNIDVQPNFFILSTFFISVFCFKFRFNLKDLILFLTCIVSILFAYTLQLDYLTFKYSATYIVSIFTAWYIVVLIKNGYIKEVTPKIIYAVIGIYALVGIIQFFEPGFLSFLVTRSVDSALSFVSSGRGVRSLTGEPAHLGKIFTLLNIFLIFLYINVDITSKIKRKAMFATICLFLVNMVISRSAYAILFHFLVVVFLLFFLYRKFFFFCMVSLLLSSAVFIPILLNIESDVRFVKLFIAALNNPDFLLGQGAIKRLFNIPITFNNLTYFNWYGAGAGAVGGPNSLIASIPTPFGKLEYLVKIRGYGGYSEFILKFGVLSAPIIAALFYSLNKIRKIVIRIDGKPYYLGYFFSIVIFVLIFQDGTPANPLPWFLLIYIYIKSYKLRNKMNYAQSY